jgi:hypothetical protein
MRDATERLRQAEAGQRHGYVLISEAVWWVTIVDATLVRYYPATYDTVLSQLTADQRELTEGTLAGLRFVRNRMGYYTRHTDFIQPPGDSADAGGGPISAWLWRRLPKPALPWLPQTQREWEKSRYRAYQAHLAGSTMGETFGRAAGFLDIASGQSVLTSSLPHRAFRAYPGHRDPPQRAGGDSGAGRRGLAPAR